MYGTYYLIFLNLIKCAKSKHIHYSPILQVCMNTCSGGSKFRHFRIILDRASSSTHVMGKMTSKLKQKQSQEETMWKTQAGKFMTSQKVNVVFCLPEFSATKILSWKYHVHNKTDIRYDMILRRDLLTTLVLDLTFSENIIIGGEGPYEGCSAPMVDLSNYDFKSLTEKIGKLKESFINFYVNKCLKYESAISSTCGMRRILDSKCEKADLNKVMKRQCLHLIPSKRESLLNLLKKFEVFFEWTSWHME